MVLNLFWSFRLHWGRPPVLEFFLEKYGVERWRRLCHSGQVRKRISCQLLPAVVNIFLKVPDDKINVKKKWLYIGKWPSHHNLLLFNIYHPKPVRKYNRKEDSIHMSNKNWKVFHWKHLKWECTLYPWSVNTGHTGWCHSVGKIGTYFHFLHCMFPFIFLIVHLLPLNNKTCILKF